MQIIIYYLFILLSCINIGVYYYYYYLFILFINYKKNYSSIYSLDNVAKYYGTPMHNYISSSDTM
jgi:hypothetical protein